MDWSKYLPNISLKNLLPLPTWKNLLPIDPSFVPWLPDFSSEKDLVDWSPTLNQSSFSRTLQLFEESTEPEINWMIIFKDGNFDPTDFDQFTVVQSGPRYQQFRSPPKMVLQWLSSTPNHPLIESIVIIGSK